MQCLKAAGHASARRLGDPDPQIFELLQAERLVECFEAELWSMASDDEELIAMAKTACAASLVPLPQLDAATLASVRASLHAFAALWSAAPQGHTALLDWD